MWRYIVCFSLALAVSHQLAYGQPARVRNANAFLKIGVSAKTESLARATIADIYALGQERINPASLISMRTKYAVGGSFISSMNAVSDTEFLGFAYAPQREYAISASLLRFGVNGIQNTLNWLDKDGAPDYDRVTRFGISDYALFLSYAHQLYSEKLSIGINAKLLYRHEGIFAQGYGLGVDLGFLSEFKYISLGLVLRDITSTWTFWDLHKEALQIKGENGQKNTLSSNRTEITIPSIDLGFNLRFWLPARFSIGAGINLHLNFNGAWSGLIASKYFTMDPAVGLWAGYREILFVRFGVRQWQWIDQSAGFKGVIVNPSGGIGIRFRGWGLDYGLNMPLTGLAMRFSHTVTISYSWGKKPGLKHQVDRHHEKISIL